MAVIIVPTSASTPHFEQETELDGVAYRLTFDWNGREGAWYLTLATASGVVLRAGLRLVSNWPLLRKLRHESRPPGELLVLDERGVGITLENLGIDVVLAYVDAESVAEATSGG